MDIAEFVKARLDEDERYLKSNRHHLWTERPLREVAAKRAILAAYCEYADARYPDYDGGYSSAMDYAVQQLATAWSDHPDYRAGWKP